MELYGAHGVFFFFVFCFLFLDYHSFLPSLMRIEKDVSGIFFVLFFYYDFHGWSGD